MATATRIISYIIPLVLLVLVGVIFLAESGAWGDLKEAVFGLQDYLPEVKVGLEEQKAEVSIPDAHKREIVKLEETIISMLSAGKENCFAKYEAFSDLGEGGTSYTFELKGDHTALTVRGGSGGKQVITDLYTEIPTMKPCVVAGTFDESERFFNHFIDGEKLEHPYYRAVNSLTIWYGTSGANGNRVSIADFDADTVNDEGDNLEDGGWLFTPDGEYICFFPTFKARISNSDKDGMDNDYFTDGEDNSIPNKIRRGELSLCY